MSIKVDMGIKSQLNAPRLGKHRVDNPKGVMVRAVADIKRKEYSPDVDYVDEYYGQIKECTKGVWLYVIMEIGERQ